MFYGEESLLRLLHLGTDGTLHSDPIDYRHYMAIPNRLEHHVQIAISDYCATLLVLYAASGISYIATKTDRFLPSGLLQFGDDKHGFTCSTFVRAIYEKELQVDIIDETGWPNASQRDRNVALVIAKSILRWVRQTEAQHDEVASIPTAQYKRFLAEDVAAAVQLYPPAEAHVKVKKRAKRIREELLDAYEGVS